MKICIVGLPKSGTSALYTAIKQAMPADTRSVFEPSKPEEIEWVVDPQRAHGITKIMFSKFHSCRFNSERFDQVIALARDPRDLLVSSLLYRFDSSDTVKSAMLRERFLKAFRNKGTDPRTTSIVDILSIFGKSGPIVSTGA